MLSCRALSLLIVGACLLILTEPMSAKNVVCYFLNWSQYRTGTCNFKVTNINPFLCTHLNFAFAQLNGNTIAPIEWNDDTLNGQWSQFNDLKKTNPSLKTLLSLGGYTHGTLRFHQMASTQANRAQFISTTINLLRSRGFDGLDIDWEYPGNDSPDDINLFSSLLKETREAFEKEAIASGKNRLLLTVAVAAGTWQASNSYNVTALQQYVDMVNVMAYDYHGGWEFFTGLNTPMASFDGLDVRSTITWYTQRGLNSAKIHLGLAMYGKSWTLSNIAQNYVGAPTAGVGTAGSCTQEGGTLTFYEICDLVLHRGYTSILDAVGEVKYAYSGNQWVSYDDKDTLSVKLDYISAVNLGGAMIWSLSEDDFTGQYCGQGVSPMISLVASRMQGTSQPLTTTASTTKVTTITAVPMTTPTTTTTAAPTTTTTTTTIKPSTASPTTTTLKTTTAAPVTTTTTTTKLNSITSSSTTKKVIKAFTCPTVRGQYPDPNSCTTYYACFGGYALLKTCPLNTVYNPTTTHCEIKSTTTFVCAL